MNASLSSPFKYLRSFPAYQEACSRVSSLSIVLNYSPDHANHYRCTQFPLGFYMDLVLRSVHVERIIWPL